MDIAVKSLDRLANEAGVESTGEISIVIFPSAEEMREQLVYTQEWAGGVAFGEYDLIMIGISPSGYPGDRRKRSSLTKLPI